MIKYLLQYVLKRKTISARHINVTKDTYKVLVTSVKTLLGGTHMNFLLWLVYIKDLPES